jgi:FtsH-binding integral membrane protein
MSNNLNNDYLLIHDNDQEQGQETKPLLTDKLQSQIRLGFIRKVYGILSAQLFMSSLMCLLSMYSKSYLQFQINNIWLLYFCLFGTIILSFLTLCFDSLLRKVPTNYIFLFTFTFMESYIIGFICGLMDPRIVFMAAFMTFALVLGLTVYAMTTKNDITMQGGLLFIISLAILMFALFAMFTDNKIVNIIISSLWIILFGIYLIYDTQLIMGNGKLMLTTDDYILASFMLYLDIINLFINLLQILNILFGGNNNN